MLSVSVQGIGLNNNVGLQLTFTVPDFQLTSFVINNSTVFTYLRYSISSVVSATFVETGYSCTHLTK